MEKVNTRCKSLGTIPFPGGQHIPEGALRETGGPSVCPCVDHAHATLGSRKTQVTCTRTLIQTRRRKGPAQSPWSVPSGHQALWEATRWNISIL